MENSGYFMQVGNPKTPSSSLTFTGNSGWTGLSATGFWLDECDIFGVKNYKPVRIVSIDNKTIKCVFRDKKEVFVTVKEPDIFDEEIGVALSICTHMFGSKTKFFDHVAEIIERPVRTEKKVEKKKKVKKT